MEQLDGKVALIIGGSGGIGRASALALGKAGARIIVAARRTEQGSAVVSEVQKNGGSAHFIQTDVNELAQVTRAVQTAVELHGRLDCAINVPGITGQPGPLTEFTDEGWAQVIQTNLTSMFWCLRAELRQMRAQGGGGRIVNISSAIGKRAFSGLGPYGATKRAVESLTETAALEVAKEGITVNAIAPGSIETDAFYGFTNGGDPAIVQSLVDNYHPMDRIGQPDEVGRAVVFLCSGATFTTGATLPVDGGWAFRT